jgi:MFS family permease
LRPLIKNEDKLFYGWVIVAACLGIATITWGLNGSFGVFFKPLAGEFGLTRLETSIISSLQAVLGLLLAIIGGWALDIYGPRIISLFIGLSSGLGLILTSQVNSAWQLFITYSFLLSLGRGTVYITIMGTISRWFDKKRGFALGIAGSGMGFASVIMAPFAAFLISRFGWRQSYIILGIIAWLIVIPLSGLLKRDPKEISALPDGAKSDSTEISKKEKVKDRITEFGGFSLRQAWGTLNFWLLGAVWLLHSFCLFLILTHIVPGVTDIGIDPIKAATVLSLYGGASIAGRLLIGRISDNIGRKKTAIGCALSMSGAMIWLTFSNDLWMFYVFGIAFGLSNGGMDPTITAFIGDTFGTRSIGVIMGIIGIAWGIGATAGPALGGFLFDASESYISSFLAGALAMLLAAFCTILATDKKNTM